MLKMSTFFSSFPKSSPLPVKQLAVKQELQCKNPAGCISSYAGKENVCLHSTLSCLQDSSTCVSYFPSLLGGGGELPAIMAGFPQKGGRVPRLRTCLDSGLALEAGVKEAEPHNCAGQDPPPWKNQWAWEPEPGSGAKQATLCGMNLAKHLWETDRARCWSGRGRGLVHQRAPAGHLPPPCTLKPSRLVTTV